MCCVLLLPLFAVEAFAKSLEDLRKERDSAASQLRRTQNELNATQAEMAQIEREIEQYDLLLSIVQEEIDITSNSLEETRDRLDKAEIDLEQAREDYDAHYAMYLARLRVMNEFGPASLLEVLLQATSIRDFLARLEHVNRVAKADREMIDLLFEKEKKVNDKKEEIEKTKRAVERLYAQLLDTQADLENIYEEKHERMEVLFETEEGYNAQLALDKAAAQNHYNIWKKADDAEQARLKEEERQRILANPSVNYDGKMRWPAPSFKQITSRYGWRRHPIHKRNEHHNGVDISSSTGNPILAAEGGTVILAGRNGSYGLCVMINHGGGLATLYGHASKILVKVGDVVSSGTKIAEIGSTGVSTGPHLHFEVHENGKSVDPKKYLNY